MSDTRVGIRTFEVTQAADGRVVLSFTCDHVLRCLSPVVRIGEMSAQRIELQAQGANGVVLQLDLVAPSSDSLSALVAARSEGRSIYACELAPNAQMRMACEVDGAAS